MTDTHAVFMRMSVTENLRVFHTKAETVVEIFPELASHLDRRVGLLSGGQQQMLALGLALRVSPPSSWQTSSPSDWRPSSSIGSFPYCVPRPITASAFCWSSSTSIGLWPSPTVSTSWIEVGSRSARGGRSTRACRRDPGFVSDGVHRRVVESDGIADHDPEVEGEVLDLPPLTSGNDEENSGEEDSNTQPNGPPGGGLLPTPSQMAPTKRSCAVSQMAAHDHCLPLIRARVVHGI